VLVVAPEASFVFAVLPFHQVICLFADLQRIDLMPRSMRRVGDFDLFLPWARKLSLAVSCLALHSISFSIGFPLLGGEESPFFSGPVASVLVFFIIGPQNPPLL